MSNEHQSDFIPSEEHDEHRASLRNSIRWMTNVQLGILLLAGAYTLYFVRPVLLPVILALLITLILKPIQRFLHEKLHILSPVAAILILIMVSAGVGSIIFYLSTPALEYSEKLRNEIVKERLKNVFQPINKIQSGISKVATEVEKITTPDESEEPDEFAPPKSIARPSIENQIKPPIEEIGEAQQSSENEKPVRVEVSSSAIDAIFDLAKSISYHLIITFVLVFFLLSYGDNMIKRITEIEATAEIMDQITTEVSRYLFKITIINIFLGIAIGLSMWALGMPSPILWGVVGATLNFIPYIGAIIGTAVVFLVGATHFENHFTVTLVPLVYYTLTTIEGNFITPAILGKSFTVNPIVIFVWVLAWGALWGIPGMLIGLPILMVVRISLSKFPAFKRLGRIISA